MSNVTPAFTKEHVFWSETEEGGDAFYEAMLAQANSVLDIAPGSPDDFYNRTRLIRSAVIANSALYEAGVDLLLVGQVRTSGEQITSFTTYEADEQGEGMSPTWRAAIDQIIEKSGAVLGGIRDVEAVHQDDVPSGELDLHIPLPAQLKGAELAALVGLYARILPAFEGRSPKVVPAPAVV